MVGGADFPSLVLFPDFSLFTLALRVGGEDEMLVEAVGIVLEESGGEEEVAVPASEASSFLFFETRGGVAIGAVCSPFVCSIADDMIN
jgi:hypothetical protein